MKHTPEPWVYVFSRDGGYDMMTDSFDIGVMDGQVVAVMDGAAYGQRTCRPLPPEIRAQMEADAARIVECVNALAGIENPAEWVAKAKARQA